MADRAQTVVDVTEYAQSNFNCQVLSVQNHASVSDGAKADHGPFAGAGFFQDLALVMEATDAFAGHMQWSSTALVLEMLEYQRRIKAWKREGSRELSNVKICRL